MVLSRAIAVGALAIGSTLAGCGEADDAAANTNGTTAETTFTLTKTDAIVEVPIH